MKLLLIVIITFVTNSLVFAANLKKSVAMIHSYPKGEWYIGLKNGLEDTLKKYKNNYQVTHHLYDYEVFKFKSDKDQEFEVKRIVEILSKEKPDFIIVNDDEAVRKFIKYLPITGNVILNGINQFPEVSSWIKNINIDEFCGIVEHYPIEKSLMMITQMSKNVKRMSVLSSNGESSQIVADIFANLSKENSQGIKTRKIYLHNKWEDWKKAIHEINGNDDIAWILVPFEVVDEKGRVMPLNEMAFWIRSNVKIPLLGILSIHTKMGFLSAISVDPYGLGKQAAEMLIKIEEGGKCKKLAFEKSKYHNFEINVSEVQRLKLKVPESFLGVAKFIKASKLEHKR